EGNQVNDWDNGYSRILHANIALEGLQKYTPNERERQALNNAKGSALFLRAYSHYQLAQLFCKPYDSNMAAATLGIPLRLQSDINVKPVRSTVEQTYRSIIDDLTEAADLLPNEPLFNRRPSRPAVFALLAKV